MSSLRVVPRRRRLRNGVLVLTAVSALAALDAQHVAAFATSSVVTLQESRPSYKAANGSWSTVELPDGTKLNAIHAVQLYNGKVLMVAGSGNDRKAFDAGTFTTVLWDPATGRSTKVHTPADLFCGGHAFLPDGNVLIAGGTRKYEVLAGKVTHAAGVMTVKNEDPDAEPMVLRKGARFRGPDGSVYTSKEEATVQPAHKMEGMVHASETRLWVQAVEAGKAPVVSKGMQFTIDDVTVDQVRNVYGVASSITLDKQEYQGMTKSYVFDVQTERYRETGDLTRARWYPTLVGTKGGDVLAVSGLDQFGIVSPGNNEVYEQSVDGWNDKPELFRYFPTYPSLLRTEDDRLFYSGSNAGYGPAQEGRQPGLWDLTDNTFAPVPGLRDADMTETSTSVMLAPAQEQKVLIAGGGAVGDSPRSTARVDVVDLDSGTPRYTAAPDLQAPARYVSSVVLPDDTTLLTGGSSGYRASHLSYTKDASLYDPATGTMTSVAPPHVGRTYHSEALLLPDGRVLTMGGDPSFADADDTTPGTFEKRFEIYTPPYLERGLARPTIESAPEAVERGTTFHVAATTGAGAAITRARLVRPSAVTHQTDSEQRSVALDVTRAADGLDLSLDPREGLTPSGWYMLFLVDDKGTPSVARWVQVR
jgi:Domain of unknown function (DUF1929)